MSYYQRNPSEEIRRFFTRRNMLGNLILINTGIWLLVKIANVLFFLFLQPGNNAASAWFLHFFAIPASIPLLSQTPWTLFTYMFLHFDFFHILFNMLWLFWFGKIFLEFLKPSQLLQTYILGGLSGAFFYVAAYNFFPVFNANLSLSYALGASASVMAIVTTISFYVPQYSIHMLFIGRIKIVYLAVILFIFDFFAIPGDNSGGHIAHIGGAVWGFVYVLILRNMKEKTTTGFTSGWFRQKWNRFTSGSNYAKPKGQTGSRPLSDEEYNMQKKTHQEKVDKILEKISKGGYDSLTKAEKDLLFKSSGKDNQL